MSGVALTQASWKSFWRSAFGPCRRRTARRFSFDLSSMRFRLASTARSDLWKSAAMPVLVLGLALFRFVAVFNFEQTSVVSLNRLPLRMGAFALFTNRRARRVRAPRVLAINRCQHVDYNVRIDFGIAARWASIRIFFWCLLGCPLPPVPTVSEGPEPRQTKPGYLAICSVSGDFMGSPMMALVEYPAAVAAQSGTSRRCSRCGGRFHELVHIDRKSSGAPVTYFSCDGCAQVLVREA